MRVRYASPDCESGMQVLSAAPLSFHFEPGKRIQHIPIISSTAMSLATKHNCLSHFCQSGNLGTEMREPDTEAHRWPATCAGRHHGLQNPRLAREDRLRLQPRGPRLP